MVALIRQRGRAWQPCQQDQKKTAMARDDDDAPKTTAVHAIGQDLSLLSVDELTARVGWLRDEIARLQAAIEKKKSSRDAAASFFKS